MIDPVALASITSAVSVLANEFFKGVASEAGKSTWAKIKQLFQWHADPPVADIPQAVATALTASPEKIAELIKLLKSSDTGAPAAMVGSIQAEKVVVIDTLNLNGGDFNMGS